MGWCPDGDFGDFLAPAFAASRVQHLSDLHSKFALCRCMVDIQSVAAEIRRRIKKKKKIEDRKKLQGKNVMVCPIT